MRGGKVLSISVLGGKECKGVREEGRGHLSLYGGKVWNESSETGSGGEGIPSRSRRGTRGPRGGGGASTSGLRGWPGWA